VSVSVALCVICHDRPDELRSALTSATTSEWSEIVVLDMASSPPLQPIAGTTWSRSETNLGPTGGYNLLAGATNADVLVFLDDDAVLRGPVADAVASLFATDDRLAVVAFKIVRADGSIRKIEHPFRGKVRDPDRARPCAYFLEGACAIRRSAMEEVGLYDADLVYSVEEVDLSFRLAAAGWRLWYEPSLVVEHRPSASGRALAPHVPAMTVRNRIVVSRRYLPLPLALVHTVAWMGRTCIHAARARHLRDWVGGVGAGFKRPVTRKPLSWSVLLRMHQLRGRVLW
jgi:GT2 family glycosyltransferase